MTNNLNLICLNHWILEFIWSLEFGICLKMRHELKYRRILTLITIGVMAIPSYAMGAPKTQFSIIYTNDVMGEVEPCG